MGKFTHWRTKKKCIYVTSKPFPNICYHVIKLFNVNGSAANDSFSGGVFYPQDKLSNRLRSAGGFVDDYFTFI